MILFGSRKREEKWIISSVQPFNTPFFLNYTQHYCTGPPLSTGIHRVDVEKILIAMLGLLLLHHRLRATLYSQSQLSVLMQWIHLSDNLLFFSKLLTLYRISYFQIINDNGDILREKFQSMQWLPGLILRERTLWARSQDRISIFIPLSIFMLNGDNEIFLTLIYFI